MDELGGGNGARSVAKAEQTPGRHGEGYAPDSGAVACVAAAKRIMAMALTGRARARICMAKAVNWTEGHCRGNEVSCNAVAMG